ncbi:unnamed protein product, partial [Cyprideis torosa]
MPQESEAAPANEPTGHKRASSYNEEALTELRKVITLGRNRYGTLGRTKPTFIRPPSEGKSTATENGKQKPDHPFHKDIKAWKESCSIGLSVVLAVPSSSPSAVLTKAILPDNEGLFSIPLCQSTSVGVHPKAVFPFPGEVCALAMSTTDGTVTDESEPEVFFDAEEKAPIS